MLYIRGKTVQRSFEFDVVQGKTISLRANTHARYFITSGKLKPDFASKIEQTSEEGVSQQDGVFVFHISEFSALDLYRTGQRPSIPYGVHNTVDVRVDALFRERYL